MMGKENPSHIKLEATEAVFSNDGKIKRKTPELNSHLDKDSTNLAASIIFSHAVNDNDNDNEAGDSKKSDNLEKQVKSGFTRLSIVRYGVYAASIVVLGGFGWSLYSVLFSNNDTPDMAVKEIIQFADSKTSEISGSPDVQLEKLANLIVQDNDWNQSRIQLMLKNWNLVNENEQSKLQSQAWYKHFQYRLENEIKYRKQVGEFKVELNEYDQLAIIKLAKIMDVSAGAIAWQKAGSNSELAKETFSDLEDEVTSNKNLNSTSKTERNAKVEKQDSKTKNFKIKNSKTKNIKNREPVIASNDPVKLGVESRQTNVNNVTPITTADIKTLLNQYKSAYEHGDVQQLVSLFGVSDSNSGKQIVEKLKSNFENVVNNSSSRTVDFKGINWRSQGEKTIVDSDYSASIFLKNNKGVQKVEASANLEVRRNNKELRIANFQLLNPKNTSISPDVSIDSNKKAANRLANLSEKDLQAMVSKFINAYESGDLVLMKSLFAEDAKTNDKFTRDGITQDYNDLFSTTASRSMSIKNLNWQYKNGYAKGTGDIQASVNRTNSKSLYSMEGKIQIVARQINGKILITHLYHIERAK